MAPIRIVTDSACDLPRALIDEHRIVVVPLSIRFGNEEFTDGVDLSTADFWKRCAASPRLPETAAPSPGAFQAAFERLADEGADGVVAVTLSAEISATNQAAVLAAEAAAATVPVRVVDSRFVTAAAGPARARGRDARRGRRVARRGRRAHHGPDQRRRASSAPSTRWTTSSSPAA